MSRNHPHKELNHAFFEYMRGWKAGASGQAHHTPKDASDEWKQGWMDGKEALKKIAQEQRVLRGLPEKHCDICKTPNEELA